MERMTHEEFLIANHEIGLILKEWGFPVPHHMDPMTVAVKKILAGLAWAHSEIFRLEQEVRKLNEQKTRSEAAVSLGVQLRDEA